VRFEPAEALPRNLVLFTENERSPDFLDRPVVKESSLTQIFYTPSTPDWQPWAIKEGSMVIYPVPAAVTQAKVQLAIDEAHKAPPATIKEDRLTVISVVVEAEQASLLDRKA
jgi:hypothetical protein